MVMGTRAFQHNKVLFNLDSESNTSTACGIHLLCIWTVHSFYRTTFGFVSLLGFYEPPMRTDSRAELWLRLEPPTTYQELRMIWRCIVKHQARLSSRQIQYHLREIRVRPLSRSKISLSSQNSRQKITHGEPWPCKYPSIVDVLTLVYEP